MTVDRPLIAVVGASGNVGRKVVEALLARGLARAEQLRLLASPRSHGQKLSIAGQDFVLAETTASTLAGVKLCLFNTESDISARWVPVALEAGAYVVDSSSHYRLHPEVPLVIPPVNSAVVNRGQHLYAHANCLASPISVVAAPLHRVWGLKRIQATTYQSTSGAGKGPMDECRAETAARLAGETYARQHFTRPVAFNVIPQVGAIREDGSTFEEYKIAEEVRKVLGTELAVTATAVRVPVLVGHSIALHLQFARAVSLDMLRDVLRESPSVKLSAEYSTPVEVEGSDEVWVGRLRLDPTLEHGVHLWLCSDNLRRGASTDAVEIAEAVLGKI